ncbi:MAG: hypothetical protein JO111_15570 [Caulobacteraceae bacterium]|nr:hypothetical protein [Caulobacteraceae bacterium]
MEPAETQIEMAWRHVKQGEAHVQKQHEIIARLRRQSLPTGQAEALLHEFESTLEEHRASLDRLEKEQSAGLRDESGNRVFGPVDKGLAAHT